jgi:hypothetical protein
LRNHRSDSFSGGNDRKELSEGHRDDDEDRQDEVDADQGGEDGQPGTGEDLGHVCRIRCF